MLKALVKIVMNLVRADCGTLVDERRKVLATMPTREERSVAREWMGE